MAAVVGAAGVGKSRLTFELTHSDRLEGWLMLQAGALSYGKATSSETQALLNSLVETLPPARLLLFVNYRPEYKHHWGSKTSYTQLRLDPLPPESALDLLHGLLGADGTIEPLTPILIERTEGNPFFLEETVRALVETKAGGYDVRPIDVAQRRGQYASQPRGTSWSAARSRGRVVNGSPHTVLNSSPVGACQRSRQRASWQPRIPRGH